MTVGLPSMKHIVLYAMRGWGHMKPLFSLIIRMAEAREDVIMTFLIDEKFDKVMGELAKLSDQRLKAIEDRIHVIDMRGNLHHSSLNGVTIDHSIGLYSAFKALYLSESLTCKTSGKVIEGLPRPTIAIIDTLGMCDMEVIRSIAPSQDVRIFAWVSGPLSAAMRQYGPKQSGGRELWKRIKREVAETGNDVLEVCTRLYTSTTGEIVHMPGFAPLYDYQWFTQDEKVEEIMPLRINAWKFFEDVDGALSPTTSVLEDGLTIAMKEYMNGLGKPFFCVGFVAANIQSSECDHPKNEVELEASTFLANMEEKFGSGSVIYIAFGTFWWPLEPAKLYALIDQLIINQTPFIFAHSSRIANVPEDVSSRISAVEFGLELNWAPQDLILRHPATGWFITHGGWNSVQESLRYGVPLIVWPLADDQPINAVLVALVHRVGFELMTVRTGEKGRTKPYTISEQCGWGKFTVEDLRNEVNMLLGKMKSEEGREVRRNVERIKKEISGLWTDGGEARKELEKFFVDCVD